MIKRVAMTPLIYLQRVVFFLALSLVLFFFCAVAVAQPLQSPPIQTKEISSQDPSNSSLPSSPSIWQKGAGATLALIPGVLVSGGGHWMIDRNQEASRLFWIKLGSLGVLLSSGALVARSGASEYVTPWGVPLLLGSGLTFLSSTLLDFIGTLSTLHPKPKSLQQPLIPALRSGEVMSFTSQIGTRQTAQTQDLYWKMYWAQQVKPLVYHLELSGSDEQLRLYVGGSKALYAHSDWGSWIQLAYTTHLNQRSAVKLQQFELTSRWEGSLGGLIGPSLNAFRAQLCLGWSGGWLSYPLGDLDAISGILGGLTLTHHSFSDRLRISLEYNHRHDGWEGGAIIKGLGSGVLGFVSTQVLLRVMQNFWLGARGAWGSTHLYTLNVGWGMAP